MLSLDDVDAVLTEMAPACVGGFIQKIQQPTPETIILVVRRPGRSLSILLSAHSQYGRVHVMSQKLSGAPVPPPFCQYVRAHLLGARIHRLMQTPHDRLVWFELKKNERTFFLVLALLGRSANLFVLDAQTTVLRSLRPSRQIVGQPFTLSPRPLADEAPGELRDAGFPVSERIEASHLISEQHALHDHQHHHHLAALRKHVKKVQRRIANLSRDFDKVNAYREYGRYGELLKSHVSALQKGQKRITVVDYFDERLPELTLPLDPEKDGPGNLKDYFAKHGKFAGAQKNLVPRLDQARTELAELQKELLALEHGARQEPGQGSAKAMPPQKLQRSTSKSQPALPYRRFCSEEGHAILVGKTAKDNDVVTFKVSGPDDLWLHARGTPGSHVIIKLKKNQQIPSETLKDAATLALFYSDLRKSGKGEIIYTLRKNVRKPKGAKPGSVTVTREKSLWIFVNQARLDRLKDSLAS